MIHAGRGLAEREMTIRGFTAEVFVDVITISLPFQKLRAEQEKRDRRDAAVRRYAKSKMIYLTSYSYVLIFYPK